MSPGVPPGTGLHSREIQPEILEWARQQLNELDTVAGMREIRETGGLALTDFLQDLERQANAPRLTRPAEQRRTG